MSKITIVGLGPGDYNLISQGALESIKNKENVVLIHSGASHEVRQVIENNCPLFLA